MSFKSLNFPNFKTTVSVEADVHGDCDTQQTELRKRGKGSPWKVVFHSDNVQRRMPFFSFLQFAAALVCSGRICRSQLGHVFRRAYTSPLRSTVFSHWESTLSSNTIGNATRLHHAQISSWNSCFFVEEVGGAHYWCKFFAPLEKHFKGVTGSKNTADGAHVLRVVRRDMVGAPEADWAEDGHPEDLALLAKNWLHSKALSQPWATIWQ